MSIETIKIVVGRALVEPDFRDLLCDDPARALAGYGLSEAEAALFNDLEREKFESVAGRLVERLSGAGLRIGGGEINKAIHSGGVISAAEGNSSA